MANAIVRWTQATLRRAGVDVTRHRPDGEMGAYFRRLKRVGFSPKTILDVGANKAEWATLARQHFPDARFLLVEPQPEMEPHLAPFLAATPRAKWIQAGAGAAPGELPLTLWEDLAGSSFLPTGTEPKHAGKARRATPIVTLDSVCAEAGAVPDLVKLDIQGYELEALKGAGTLMGRTELFILEVSLYEYIAGWPLLADVVAFLDARGYRVHDFVGHFRRPLDEALGQVDLAFARKDGLLMKDQRWSAND